MSESIQDPRPTDDTADGAPGESDPHCLRCGYNLRGLRDFRCPECGTPFDPSEPTLDPTASWGPLVWESRQPILMLPRLYRTLVGLVFHPVASIRQLGIASRRFGRAQLLFLLWLSLLASGMAVLTTAMWKLAYDYLDRFGRAGSPRTLSDLWLDYQIGWFDSVIATILHGAIALHLVAVVALLNRNHDTYRELASLIGLFGAAVMCGILAPAPEALIPAILVIAGSAGLIVYEYDRIDWRRTVSHALRALTYLAGIILFVDLYITTADHIIVVLNNRHGPYRVIIHWADRVLSLTSISILAVLLYVLIRSIFRTDRLRAAGATVIYAVLAATWLTDVPLVQEPLRMFTEFLGFAPYR